MPRHLSTSVSGYLSAILSACTFGLIPLFVVPLLGAGYSATAILVYRTLFSCVALLLIMGLRHKPLPFDWRAAPWIVVGGVLYFCSAWFLVLGYTYIHSGLATTLHFSYPIFVALLLLVLHRRLPSHSSLLALLFSVAGVAIISLLSGETGTPPPLWSTLLILLSGLTYALYIVALRYSRLSQLEGDQVTCYVMAVACLLFVAVTWHSEGTIPLLSTPREWSLALLLALLPTIVSNLALVRAVRLIGSGKTSVLGALEPLTALVIGTTLLGEELTPAALIGVALILLSVYLVINDPHSHD